MTDDKIAGAMDQAKAQFESVKEMVQALAKAEENPENADPSWDDAQQAIYDDPLSVLVRDGWREPGKPNEEGPEEYEILLCTGGPAVRIIGTLNRCEPETARLECQDWFTPWIEWRGEGWDEDVLLSYARQFYFGD